MCSLSLLRAMALNSSNPRKSNVIIIPISQMRKLRPREVKYLAHSCPVGMRGF